METRVAGGGLVFALEPHPLAASLAEQLAFDEGKTSQRLFPDGEFYLRIETVVKDKHCIVLADLSHPQSRRSRGTPVSPLAEGTGKPATGKARCRERAVGLTDRCRKRPSLCDR